jgi:hypothetical protein
MVGSGTISNRKILKAKLPHWEDNSTYFKCKTRLSFDKFLFAQVVNLVFFFEQVRMFLILCCWTCRYDCV